MAPKTRASITFGPEALLVALPCCLGKYKHLSLLSESDSNGLVLILLEGKGAPKGGKSERIQELIDNEGDRLPH